MVICIGILFLLMIIDGIVKLIEKSPVLENKELPYKDYNIGNNKPEKLMDFIQSIEDA